MPKKLWQLKLKLLTMSFIPPWMYSRHTEMWDVISADSLPLTLI